MLVYAMANTTRHIRDLTGERFGKWTVLHIYSYGEKYGCKQTKWTCRCDCGTIKESIIFNSLTTGKSKSCGCLRRELLKARLTGKKRNSYKREYRIWMGIKTRCFNSKHVSYERYGSIGITMCDRWRESFEAFLADMGPCPDELTIDRINNLGNYEPGNCRWATREQQSQNRRSAKAWDYKGQPYDLIDLASKENVHFRELWKRAGGDERLEDIVDDLKARGMTFDESQLFTSNARGWTVICEERAARKRALLEAAQ